MVFEGEWDRKRNVEKSLHEFNWGLHERGEKFKLDGRKFTWRYAGLTAGLPEDVCAFSGRCFLMACHSADGA